MSREEVPMDQETFDRVLAEELGKGTDRRVAEGRARSAAVRAYRKAHGEPERAPRPAAPAAAPPGDGDGAGGDGGAAAPQPVGVGAPAAAAAAPGAPGGTVIAPARIAPPPTGRPPSPKPGAPDKHRLLALVPPEGVQRVEREQGDRVNTFPHLMIEEFVALLIVSVLLTVFSTIVYAPLRDMAHPNLTPNPSKAPWY